MFEATRAGLKALFSPNTQTENDAKCHQTVSMIGETDVAILRTELVEKKYDVSAVSDDGWSILNSVILFYSDDPHIEEKIKILIELGADPNAGGHTEWGPGPSLTIANARIMKLLLTMGADPNILVKDHDHLGLGNHTYTIIYEDLYRSYLIENWKLNQLKQLKEGRPSAHASPDEWLEYLDRAAIEQKKLRPESLKLLRQFGGKTMPEYVAALKAATVKR
jgi:hypothetical protein